MDHPKSVLWAACFLFLCLPAVLTSQATDPGGKPGQDVKRGLEKLRRQMEEMKKRHAVEIEAIRKKLESLGQSRNGAGAEEQELEKLRRLADQEATKEEESDQESEETMFKIGGLSLQALNPEISIVGDLITSYRYQDRTRDRADFDFRTLGLHFESYLDPYTKLKAAVPVNEKFAALGEGYLTRFGVLEGINLTAGKFRQQFGVVNRWHKHGLDQVDFPLALRKIFGDGGLNQTGLSLDWSLPPLRGTSQALTLQVTNGENGRLFSGNTLSTPSCLLHYKNFHDISKDFSLEVGVTGLVGWNDEWEVVRGTTIQEAKESLSTRVFGVDCTLLWEPTDRMRYRHVEWRTEFFFLNRDILAPDDENRDTINAWGAYTYVQTKLSRWFDVGVRLDFYKPDHKPYAGSVPSLSHLVADDRDAHRWSAAPYVTWHQSPFVRVRLEYDHLNGKGMERPEHLVMLQIIFAAGPHKHERY